MIANQIKSSFVNESQHLSSLKIVCDSVTKKDVYGRKVNINDVFDKDELGNYLESLVMQNSSLVLMRNQNLLLRKDHETMLNNVKILSGGIAGVEPLHSGFVGKGFLTAAVLGSSTSGPSYVNILTALRTLGRNHEPGVLVIIMNNLADRLNFGIACQLATREGIKVLCLVVGEDCSGVMVDKTIGRRGLAGILLLQKIAGAMSEEKRSLYEIHCVLEDLKGKLLGSVNIGFIPEGIDVGLGLKGQPGKVLMVRSICQVVNEALFYIIHPASYFSLQVSRGDRVVVLINNLGNLSDLHLSLTVREVLNRLTFLEIKIVKMYSGRFLTVKDTVGFSVSILKVVSDNVLKWLDANTNVICWPNRTNELEATCASSTYGERCLDIDPNLGRESMLREINDERPAVKNLGPRFSLQQATYTVRVLTTISDSLIKMKTYLNIIDEDNDYGTKMETLMLKIKNAMNMKSLQLVTPYGLLMELAELSAEVGGVMGAVFSVMLCSAAQAFLSGSRYTEVSWRMWQEAAVQALHGVTAYTRARLGHCTVLDALQPFTEEFITQGTVACLSRAVRAAVRGAELTFIQQGASQDIMESPDPGALSVAVILIETLTELQVDLLEAECEALRNDDFYCEACLGLMLSEQCRNIDYWFCPSCFYDVKKTLVLEQIHNVNVWFCEPCFFQTKIDVF